MIHFLFLSSFHLAVATKGEALGAHDAPVQYIGIQIDHRGYLGGVGAIELCQIHRHQRHARHAHRYRRSSPRAPKVLQTC